MVKTRDEVIPLTINQIRYFITVAKCLNFTKAADQLYISQSSLSRQISSMESELNLQLFQRTQRYVKLTPAGKVLYNGLARIHSDYASAVSEAKTVQYGMSGSVNVGILDGTIIEDFFPPAIHYFNVHYPNVEISLRNYSFNGLVEGLYDGSLDLAVTLYFDIEERSNLMHQIIEKTTDHIAVPVSHPLADEENVTLADFEDDVFIIIAHEDSGLSGKLILDACKKQGFVPQVRYSPSIQTSMLWVQAGIGVTMLDSRNQLSKNPDVRFLNIDPVSDPSLSLVWSQDNQNPYRVKLARELMKQVRNQ